MLDILLIQHIETGINLLEYRQEETRFKSEHADIFSGFMSALKTIMSVELDIGTVVLISTSGKRGHNCIIVSQDPIEVVMLVDEADPIDLWRSQGTAIIEEFIERFGTDFNPNNISQFKEFYSVIKQMCAGHNYCE